MPLKLGCTWWDGFHQGWLEAAAKEKQARLQACPGHVLGNLSQVLQTIGFFWIRQVIKIEV